jgi:hypothetical protein
MEIGLERRSFEGCLQELHRHRKAEVALVPVVAGDTAVQLVKGHTCLTVVLRMGVDCMAKGLEEWWEVVARG